MRPTWCAVALVACVGCGESDEAARLVVSAASSMTEALEACAPRFGEVQGAEMRLSFAGSDELAAQIRQGAKVDAYAAANTRIPEELYNEDLLEQPVEFATNELVLAVPKDSEVDSLDDLTREGTTVVIGSGSVPIGAYTRETLGKLPPAQEQAILDNVRSNEPDVKGIVGKLTQGAADAGFVYVTDVNATDGELKAVELPQELEPEVTYGAGVVRKAERPELARRFVDGLARGECADALAQAGFGPAP
jgi:molybdate transport system substrate-binding protein